MRPQPARPLSHMLVVERRMAYDDLYWVSVEVAGWVFKRWPKFIPEGEGDGELLYGWAFNRTTLGS